MFENLRKVRLVAQFVGARADDYVRLARMDAVDFQREIVRTTIGYGVMAGAGLLFSCFLSVAIIVTAWDSAWRSLVAWLVCAVWALLAGAGLVYGKRALKSPTPFEDLTSEFSKDFEAIKEIF